MNFTERLPSLPQKQQKSNLIFGLYTKNQVLMVVVVTENNTKTVGTIKINPWILNDPLSSEGTKD